VRIHACFWLACREPIQSNGITSPPADRSSGESFLFQDSLEEAVKVQHTLDPIPAKRASWPDKTKKQTNPQTQSSYSGNDFQGSFSMPKPKGNAPRNDSSGGRSAQWGSRGQKRLYTNLSPRRPRTKPLPPLLILLKEGKRSEEWQVTPPLTCWSVVGGTTSGCHRLLRHMVSKKLTVPGIIRQGLHLDFISQPPTTSYPSPVHLPQDLAKAYALRAEIGDPIRAIVPIDNPGPGFYSHIFVVPKKQKGSWRLIIDLSWLNCFLWVPHFKILGDWACSITNEMTFSQRKIGNLYQISTRSDFKYCRHTYFRIYLHSNI
jgi:hypothetical protein